MGKGYITIVDTWLRQNLFGKEAFCVCTLGDKRTRKDVFHFLASKRSVLLFRIHGQEILL